MTDPRRTAAALLVPLALVLAGCTEDDAGPLAEDQLPGKVVESKTRTSGVPTATSCSDLNQAQLHLSVSAASEVEDPGRYWSYRLEDGSWVLVHVMEIGTPVSDPAGALDEIAAAIGSCADDPDAEVARLVDVPEDSVGYRSTTTDSNGTREAETLVAAAGDRVVMVIASHEQGTEPSVDVRDVLDDVRDTAADIDLG